MTEQEKSAMEENWREVPRSEMFGRVIAAVDCSRGDAEAHGDPAWMRYCEEQLFPFFEAEREKARASETERDEYVAYLTGDMGLSEEVRLILRDDDLWILDTWARYGPELDGEAGMREWEAIVSLADGLAELATNKIDRRSHAAYLRCG